ncbi:hypothetical protein H2200_007654 [Cladophialophora chaetospira]|uniref:GA4 desaturase n=1 Tax=Cladophialophora chaetospira TaxID=386627 RepID=A0AA38X6L1_9EURO|nr:hypothetical protein H2200_007654 [Cladophialophora chaetospira]
MSQTMTETHATAVRGAFRYGEPDSAIPADKRSLFSQPHLVNLQEETLPLRDYRSDTKLVRGVEGLHKHGFTLVEHHLDPHAWDDEAAVRGAYIPSVEQLVKNVTGCKTAIVNNVAFRRKHATQYDADKNFYHPRDGDLDKMLATLPCDRAMISPIDPAKSLEPARSVHVDYTMKGLLDTVRYCREDMSLAGTEALKAIDAGKRPPRVAAYSVWRPLKPVIRDPIAILNWTSPGDITKDLRAFDYRAKGYKGDYLLEAYTIAKPKNLENHEWYYVSEQKPHEVLMFKFADTESQYDPEVAVACGHASPMVIGTEKEDPRESIEARVLAFW